MTVRFLQDMSQLRKKKPVTKQKKKKNGVLASVWSAQEVI